MVSTLPLPLPPLRGASCLSPPVSPRSSVTFSEYMEGELSGLMMTMVGPA